MHWGFSRTQLDEFSLGSHEKAAMCEGGGQAKATILELV
jgi:acetyl-CoA acyltransferase